MYASNAVQNALSTSRFDGPRIADQIIGYVTENFSESITLDDLAREAGMSRYGFCRRFHKECGLPPMRWLWNFRTILAAEFISLDPKWSLTDIAFSCGFTSSAHFSRTFKAMYGKSPSQFRKEVLAGASGRERGRKGLELILGQRTNVVAKAMSSAMILAE